MLSKLHPIMVIGGLVLVVVILREPVMALLATYPQLGIHPLAAFSVSTAVIAVITFFGFMWLCHQQGGSLALTKGGLRLAIVASVVTTDLVLISTVTFFTTNWEVPKLTENFLTQFNTIVGVVVAFYFGTSAYVQVHSGDGRRKEKADGNKVED